MQNVVTDAFLRHGGGKYRLSLEARAAEGGAVALEAVVITNERRVTRGFSIPGDGEWHAVSEELDLDFDVAATDLVSVFLRTTRPCAELSFRKLSLRH